MHLPSALPRGALFLASVTLLLCAACSAPPVRRAPPPAPPASRADAALEARCRAVEAAHQWQRSAPPGQPARSFFTVPAGATRQLWFRGRNDAMALCTPCRGGSAVQSFEWYEPGFRKGELKLLKCGTAR